MKAGITFSLAMTLLAGSNALAWEKIIDCNDGALVVDKQVESREFGPVELYQVVVNDRGVQQYFIDRGAANYALRQNFVIGVQKTSYGNFVGTPGSDVKYYASKRGEGLQLTAMGLYRDNGPYQPPVEHELASWYFESCR